MYIFKLNNILYKLKLSKMNKKGLLEKIALLGKEVQNFKEASQLEFDNFSVDHDEINTLYGEGKNFEAIQVCLLFKQEHIHNKN